MYFEACLELTAAANYGQVLVVAGVDGAVSGMRVVAIGDMASVLPNGNQSTPAKGEGGVWMACLIGRILTRKHASVLGCWSFCLDAPCHGRSRSCFRFDTHDPSVYLSRTSLFLIFFAGAGTCWWTFRLTHSWCLITLSLHLCFASRDWVNSNNEVSNLCCWAEATRSKYAGPLPGLFGIRGVFLGSVANQIIAGRVGCLLTVDGRSFRREMIT